MGQGGLPFFTGQRVSGILYIMSSKASKLAGQEGAASTSFEERSVWIQLISNLVGMGVYAAVVGPKLLEGVRVVEDDARAQVVTPSFYPLLLAVALVILINVVGHTVAAIGSRPEGRDERDRVIGWRAAHGSEWLLGLGTVAGITALMFEVEGIWIAHLLLLFLYLSEILCCVLKLAFYRRGL